MNFPERMQNIFGGWDNLTWCVVTAAVLIIPLIAGEGYYLTVMNFIALYSIVTIGLCLLVGYGGQLALSHAAFFAIGAYASAIFSLRCNLHPLLAILLAQFVTGAVAWGIGTIVLRLRGHYLAIATLSFSIIIEILLKEMQWLTGGTNGLSSIPSISFGTFSIASEWRFYFLIWPLALLLLLFALNLVNSRMGRIIRAIKEGEDATHLMGANVKAYKVRLFILSSVYASLAGSFYGHFLTFVSPGTASVMFAIEIIMISAFGGFILLWGGVVGAASLTVLNEYLSVFSDYKRMFYGLSLVCIMVFFPNGLLQGFKDFIGFLIRLTKQRKMVKRAAD